ncbi:MAG TPA: ribosome biogenesis GTPase YlqF, partial [Clostridia bacterium]|nr:ribosome biogenesis GTPase YlqF [Clostridia bacterium]
MDIQWYPGHMKKTRDLISQNYKLVDLIIELLDARAPRSSLNPIFDDVLGDKKRLFLLNKSDLSDP